MSEGRFLEGSTRQRLSILPGVGEWPIAPLWTADDVAAFLRVPVQTLYSWRTQRRGPRARRVGKYLRYRPEDVQQWLDGLDDGAA
jgi:predicted DNA-binding transcriptional regulator AlpA